MALRGVCGSSLRRSILGFQQSKKVYQSLGSFRCYIPVTPVEEEQEKKRVASLSDFQKDQELRKYNREIARLEALKGINTGERYTWSGRYKSLARDYGMPLVVWYWACWGVTFAGCFGAITLGGVDAMALIAKADTMTGWELTSRVDPEDRRGRRRSIRDPGRQSRNGSGAFAENSDRSSRRNARRINAI